MSNESPFTIEIKQNPNFSKIAKSSGGGILTFFIILVVLVGIGVGIYFAVKMLSPQPAVQPAVQPVVDNTQLKAQFYAHCDYKGTMAELGVGSWDASNMIIANDILSSVKVPKGLKVTLYADDNFKGASKVLTSDSTCLTDFNDMTSSIKIETL